MSVVSFTGRLAVVGVKVHQLVVLETDKVDRVLWLSADDPNTVVQRQQRLYGGGGDIVVKIDDSMNIVQNLTSSTNSSIKGKVD